MITCVPITMGLSHIDVRHMKGTGMQTSERRSLLPLILIATAMMGVGLRCLTNCGYLVG